MLGSARRRSRAGLWFAAFTILSLLMLLASRTAPAATLQQASARVLDPVRQAIAGVGDGIGGLFGTIGEINRLPVRIISRDPSNFTWEVGIDAGTNDGVRPDMAVVGSAEGAGALAGTVVSAGPDTARVRFIVDTRSSVIALDQQTRAMGLVRGQLGGQLVMVDVQSTDKVAQQDAIVSAGLSLANDARSAYPKGLLIGHIQAIQQDSNALTQTAFVRPALDFTKIDRLLVVTS